MKRNERRDTHGSGDMASLPSSCLDVGNRTSSTVIEVIVVTVEEEDMIEVYLSRQVLVGEWRKEKRIYSWEDKRSRRILSMIISIVKINMDVFFIKNF